MPKIDKKFMSTNSRTTYSGWINNIYHVSDFDDLSCQNTMDKLSLAEQNNCQKQEQAQKENGTFTPDPVNLYVNSRGGACTSLFGLLDRMSLMDTPIRTIGFGQCCSCGAVLLSAGDKGERYATPNCRILIHQVLGGAQGSNTDVQTQAKEMDRINELCMKTLAENCGKTVEEIKALVEKGDCILTAQEALDLGLIDHILEKKTDNVDDDGDGDNELGDTEAQALSVDKKATEICESVLKLEIKSVTEDDEYFYIQGIASTPDVDLKQDIITPDSLTASVKDFGLPKFAHNHDYVGKPLGITEKVEQITLDDGKIGTVISTKMPKSVQDCQDIHELAKMGAYGGLSIGFITLDYKMQGNVRVVNKLLWLETSLVTLPANMNAKLLEVKDIKEVKDISDVRSAENYLIQSGMSKKDAQILISTIKKAAPVSDLQEGEGVGEPADSVDLTELQNSLVQLNERITTWQMNKTSQN